MRDAIVEPCWSGVRVLARFEGNDTRLIDEEGIDCTAEFSDVANAISVAALAGELILDGFLTVEPTQIVAGVPPREIQAPTTGQMMTQWIVGNRIARPSAPHRNLDPDRPIAFVAVDLLRIDGSPLLSVPLLERKRLLDGSLEPSALVRVTPFVRPPVGSFAATWRGAGFNAIAYKDANSRYEPDVRNDDWSVVSIPLR
jgi:ATP-dependent DNA ligase